MIPFEKDTFIPARMLELKEKFNVETIIETGTQYGYTTKWFSENFDNVFTIEADANHFSISRENLKGIKNITSMFGKSEDLIMDAISQAKGKILFFLDAHGCEIGGTALLEELRAIGEIAKNSVVAIHDFKVPNRNFGFDTYDGKDLDLEFIQNYIPNIYPWNCVVEFNQEANGAERGIVYFYENI